MHLLHFIFSDLEKFDFYKFSEHYDDYKYAMELTSEILFLEVIYRILVCIFEVFLFIISMANFKVTITIKLNISYQFSSGKSTLANHR